MARVYREDGKFVEIPILLKYGDTSGRSNCPHRWKYIGYSEGKLSVECSYCHMKETFDWSEPLSFKKEYIGILYGLIFLIIISLPTVGCQMCLSGGCSSGCLCGGSEDDEEIDAYIAAKKAVESNLKSPSTAKFCKMSECKITSSGDTYTVSGWVDAQNSFGATIRSDFTVVLTLKSPGNFVIDSCYID